MSKVSTYSVLCESLLEQIKSPQSEQDYETNIEAFKLLVKSLGLQHRARLNDQKLLADQTSDLENEIAQLESQYAEQEQELEQLRAAADKRRAVAQLAKQKFEQPTIISTTGNSGEQQQQQQHSVKVILNKSAAQLDEDYKFLEEESQQLQESLNSKLIGFDRNSEIVDELFDALREIKDRLDNPDAYPRRSREPENRLEGSEASEASDASDGETNNNYNDDRNDEDDDDDNEDDGYEPRIEVDV